MKYLFHLTFILLLAACASKDGLEGSARGPASVDNRYLALLTDFNNRFDSQEQAIRQVKDLTPGGIEDNAAEKSISFQKDLSLLGDLLIGSVMEVPTQKYDCSTTTHLLSAYDPTTGGLGGIQIRVYQPRVKTRAGDYAPLSPVRSVLLVPPTGGENPLDKGYADIFCYSGIRTAILERWDGDWDSAINPDLHDRGAVRAVAAVRHAVEFLAPNGEPIGILGTSVGAITSVLTMGYEPRIEAAALIVGGIHLDQIISTSTEENLTRLRRERTYMQSENASSPSPLPAPLSPEGYASLMHNHIHIEPGDKLNNTQAKFVWMQVASKDITVPTEFQRNLRTEFSNNRSLRKLQLMNAENEYDGDHMHTIVYTYAKLRYKIRDFFKDHVPLSQK